MPGMLWRNGKQCKPPMNKEDKDGDQHGERYHDFGRVAPSPPTFQFGNVSYPSNQPASSNSTFPFGTTYSPLEQATYRFAENRASPLASTPSFGNANPFNPRTRSLFSSNEEKDDPLSCSQQ